MSDKKLQHTTNNTTVDYYNADVVTANDYYPFGSQMPGRKYSQPNSSYRYGFNGKENDNDVKGDGNQQDYGARIYDPRLGRFLSVDPLTKAFSWYSPYQFAGNMPIAAIDLDGEEQKIMINWVDANGAVGRTKIVKGDFNTVNSLYISLKEGLNTKTTYDLEGTKFNSTNAIFTSGFEEYKKGGPTRKPNERMRPNNGTLSFNIYQSGNVLISYTNEAINEKELFSDALRGASKVASVVGTAIEGAGYVASVIPGGQTVGLPLIGIGKGVSLFAGDLSDISADLLVGKTNDAGIKAGVAVAGEIMGAAVDKLPIKKIGKQAIDTYGGRGTGAIKDGYFDNRTVKVEESDKLDLKIEQKK